MDITYTITQTMRPNGALIKMEAWESNEETHYIVTNSKNFDTRYYYTYSEAVAHYNDQVIKENKEHLYKKGLL